MAKRSASLQLTNENWDQEEEDEEPGQFKPAATSSIQNRVIRKAKRRLAEHSEGSSSSPFSAFTGFKNHSAEPFSFGKPVSASAKSDKQNGSDSTEKKTSQPTFESQSLKRSHMADDDKTESKNLEHFRQLQQLNESVLKWMQTHMQKNPYCDFTPVFKDYMGHLSKLEKTYPLKNQSYSDTSSSAIPNFSTQASSFKMPESSSSEQTSFVDDASANAIAKSGFSNFMKSVKRSDEEAAKNNSDDPEMSYGAGFKSNTTNTSTFSFGIKKSLTATSSGSPIGPTSSSAEAKDKKNGDDDSEEISKDEGDAEKKTAPTFSFGVTKFGSSSIFNKKDNEKSEAEPFRFSSAMCGAKPFSFASAPKNSEPGAEDSEYVPPKNEVNLVVEDDVLYSKRCKLFFKRDDNFVDKGVGTLYLKPLDGKTQLLVRADTNLGNILLNIMLTSSLPIEKTGKNNVLIVCVPNPPIDAKKPDSKEAIPMLIRVKTSTDADELFEVLNKHKS